MEGKNIWLAIVEVEPISGNKVLEGAKGAFVNVAYVSESKKSFFKEVDKTFGEYDFKVLEVDDIECYPNIDIYDYETAEKIELVNKLINEDLSYCIGIFHTYYE